MSAVQLKRIGTWLAVVAITLQAVWPLLVSAKPRSIALVPLCTVDGVTHFIEVPTGKAPAGESSSHGDHCAFCFLGDRTGLPAQSELLSLTDGGAEVLALSDADVVSKIDCKVYSARAPPVSPVVIATNDNLGRHDEQAFGIGRACLGATDCSRILRLRVLHR
jgi:hypothetical protein